MTKNKDCLPLRSHSRKQFIGIFMFDFYNKTLLFGNNPKLNSVSFYGESQILQNQVVLIQKFL